MWMCVWLDMGGLQSLGPREIAVSFGKEPYEHRVLLTKETWLCIELKSLSFNIILLARFLNVCNCCMIVVSRCDTTCKIPFECVQLLYDCCHRISYNLLNCFSKCIILVCLLSTHIIQLAKFFWNVYNSCTIVVTPYHTTCKILFECL